MKVQQEISEWVKGSIYNNGNLYFWNDKYLTIPADILQFEMFSFVLCLKGRASANVNGVTYEILPNDAFICCPQMLMKDIYISSDFKCNGISTTSAYIKRVIPMTDDFWSAALMSQRNPKVTLTAQEVTEFCRYYELICYKALHLQTNKEKVINALMLAFFYDMESIIGEKTYDTSRIFTSGEQYFRRFVEMLSSAYPKNRKVGYYAGKLNITPKYLSSVCKVSCQETASHIIDMYVNRDIEYLMKYSTKSIKEIAMELDFPNLSFFGKYVKKHFGFSPKAYRRQLLNDNK